MRFVDEDMVQLREEEKKKRYVSFATGFYIGREVVPFHRAIVFEEQMSVMLPRSFAPLTEELKKIKYPNEGRPELVMSSADCSVNFAFSLTDLPMRPEEAGQIIGQCRSVIQTLHPANLFYDLRTETREEGTLAWFDHKSYALDGQLYNLLFVLPVGGRLMQGVFNCGFDLAGEWKEPALAVMRSIEDLTKRKEIQIK